ncbi:MAG: hypothetical protein EOO88_50575, partial [Pedobacter sp.]
MYNGKPQLAVNENFFRIEAPPHLQQNWKGNVYGDSSHWNISTWNVAMNTGGSYLVNKREPAVVHVREGLQIIADSTGQVLLVNNGNSTVTIIGDRSSSKLDAGSRIPLGNPFHARLVTPQAESWLHIEPHAFMRNYYVNGARYYTYPLGNDFTWAKHFADNFSVNNKDNREQNIFVSFDYTLMDSVSHLIQQYLATDTAYHSGAEYGVCIADEKGRVLAMNDYIKDFYRPDPNNRAAFNKTVIGENGWVSQSLLRKQIGNINLLRMNPGPGSTLKPIVFASVASQLPIDWSKFSSDGFNEKQNYYAGEKVAPYDFEKNNGRINSVIDYLRYSDNYYHSNVLLLGSYSRQDVNGLLSSQFSNQKTGNG